MNIKSTVFMIPAIALSLATTAVSADTLFVDEKNEMSYMVPQHGVDAPVGSSSVSYDKTLFIDEQNEASYTVSLPEVEPTNTGTTLSYEANLFIDEQAEMAYL